MSAAYCVLGQNQIRHRPPAVLIAYHRKVV